MSGRDKRLERAQLRVLLTVPFFGPGVCKLPVVWDNSIPTACTDGKNIRWNPDWFDKLDDQVLVTVLCHEVCHALLGHLWRAPSGADADQWNEACDHAVNLQLEEFGNLVKAKNLADPFPFPSENICKNPAFKNMAEEQIYACLNRNKGPQGQQPQPGQGNKPGSGQGQGQGQGKPQPGQGQGQGQGGGRNPFGEFTLCNSQDAAQKKNQNDWQHTLIQACAIGKGRGELPGGMAKVLGDFLDPKVPWWEYVHNWLREQCSDDWNWSKPNLMYADSEFLLPRLESDQIGAAVFATDTSGSTFCVPQLLEHFQSEKQSFLDELRPRKLVDIYCDSAIQSVREYTIGDQISKDTPGGGGTSFVPVFEYCDKMPVPPKCLVYLTDLDGAFPSEAPNYPVLWIVYDGGQTKAPFGTIVEV